MDRSIQLVAASVVVGTLMALIWFKAPIAPALVGALVAAWVLYWRARRNAH
jgi:hypothetical protein